MKDATVLVTGASGFVGSAVARGAAARGAQVRVMVRKTSPRENFADFPCEIAEGDMRDAASVARAMDGVRYLFHVAADYRLWARDPDEIVRNNREGTRIVMEAAREAGVTEFLAKPISVKALSERLTLMIDNPSRFVRTATYFGPDRRRKDVGPPKGMADRRKSGPGDWRA